MLPETFETARLRLRPIAMTDAPASFGAYAQDSELTRYMIWRPHLSVGETELYIRGCLASPRRPAPPASTRWWIESAANCAAISISADRPSTWSSSAI